MLLYSMIADLAMILHRLSKNRCEKMVFSLNLNKQSGLWSWILGFIGVSQKKSAHFATWSLSEGTMAAPGQEMVEQLADPEAIQHWHWSSDDLKRWSFVCCRVPSYPYRVGVVFVCMVGGIRWCTCVGERVEIQVVCVWYCSCIEDICSIRLHTYVYIIVHRNWDTRPPILNAIAPNVVIR